jgi:hypothetical protein
MSSVSYDVTDELRQQVATAIRLVHQSVRWKPGSAMAHLLKRQLRGHLPPNATLADYERLILTIVTVVAVIEDRHWLVMFGLDGVMESAYVVENPDRYLSKPDFEKLGLVSEVLA